MALFFIQTLHYEKFGHHLPIKIPCCPPPHTRTQEHTNTYPTFNYHRPPGYLSTNSSSPLDFLTITSFQMHLTYRTVPTVTYPTPPPSYLLPSNLSTIPPATLMNNLKLFFYFAFFFHFPYSRNRYV